VTWADDTPTQRKSKARLRIWREQPKAFFDEAVIV